MCSTWELEAGGLGSVLTPLGGGEEEEFCFRPLTFADFVA